MTLTPRPLLVSWSRKSKAIPLLSLWAVRPAQSLSVCTRVHFNLLFNIQLPTVNDIIHCHYYLSLSQASNFCRIRAAFWVLQSLCSTTCPLAPQVCGCPQHRRELDGGTESWTYWPQSMLSCVRRRCIEVNTSGRILLAGQIPRKSKWTIALK